MARGKSQVDLVVVTLTVSGDTAIATVEEASDQQTWTFKRQDDGWRVAVIV